jgi:glycosyltransferase involved in cell wall biosynthesis
MNDTMRQDPEVVDVSVVIPSYNTASFIREALDSVFAQTFRGSVQVVVVNDGSPDTPELENALRPYLGQITYIVQQNKGLAGARNAGIAACRGQYIAFLDSDDSWLPDYLAVLAAALDNNAEAAAVFPDEVIFGDTPEAGRISRVSGADQEDITFTSFVSGKSWISAGAMVRRPVLERYECFDERLRQVEDFDLWLRMLHGGERILYVPQVLIRYRRWSGSLSANTTRMFDTQLAVLAKSKSDLALTDSQKAAVEERMVQITARKLLHEGKLALRQRRFSDAAAALRVANETLKSGKVAAAVRLLSVSPNLAWTAYRVFARN